VHGSQGGGGGEGQGGGTGQIDSSRFCCEPICASFRLCPPIGIDWDI